MEFSGRLASVPLADLLQWAHQDRRTGCLVVRSSVRQKRVFFEDGAIIGCYSDDPSEYFGQQLLLYGYLEHEQLREALAHCRQDGVRLGSALVELEMLTLETAQEALRHQIIDVVCGLFLWTNGVFYFEKKTLPKEQLLPKPIDTLAVALEGVRWVDQQTMIDKVFVHGNILLCRGKSWERGGLTPLEERIVERFTDLLPIGDLYLRVKGSHFRFLEALFQLTLNGVVDIDSVGEESVSRASREIRIFDLMMEQAAAEEEVVFSESHLSLPIEVLHSFYPLWIALKEEDDTWADRRNLDELTFCQSMDGSRSMHELIVENAPQREKRMELVMVELRRGNLALLPRPFEELSEVDRHRPWLKHLFGTG